MVISYNHSGNSVFYVYFKASKNFEMIFFHYIAAYNAFVCASTSA